MSTTNRLVTNNDNGTKRETLTNGPASETEWARNQQLGPLRKANVGANASAVALTLGGVDTDAGSAIVAPQDGQIVALQWAWTAAPTHTAATFQATLGGTAGGDVVTIDQAQTGAVVMKTPIAFVAGNSLGAKVTTDANFLPVTDDLSVWLTVRWNP